jgi:hypothetical protein
MSRNIWDDQWMIEERDNGKRQPESASGQDVPSEED